MNFEEAMQLIHHESGRGIELGLQRMAAFLKDLGNPEKKCKMIHVAGTNGKGSTSAFLTSMLAEHNLKVGRYSSPAVFAYEEIISYQTKNEQEKISRQMICEHSEELLKVIQKWKKEGRELPTTFEMETALAFLAFSKWECDVVILEVGLGGLEDATNVIEKPLVSVITSISLDHQHILGDTIEKIAEQKAGIIKKNRIVVCSEQEPAVKRVLDRKAQKENASIFTAEAAKIIEQSLEKTEFQYKNQIYQIHLYGEHQVANASLALEAVEHLPNDLKPTEEEKNIGLRKASWQGRFEILDKNPYVIIDGAHNIDGARTLKNTIKTLFGDKKICGIMGVFKDKNYSGIIEVTKDLFEEMLVVRAEGDRALDPNELKMEWERHGFMNVKPFDNIKEAITYYKNKCKKEDVILMFGSLSFLKQIHN